MNGNLGQFDLQAPSFFIPFSIKFTVVFQKQMYSSKIMRYIKTKGKFNEESETIV